MKRNSATGTSVMNRNSLHGNLNDRPSTYVTKACVIQMKKQIGRVIAENTKLKTENFELLHEISALKIALEAKEIEKANTIHIYEDLLKDLLPQKNPINENFLSSSSQGEIYYDGFDCEPDFYQSIDRDHNENLLRISNWSLENKEQCSNNYEQETQSRIDSSNFSSLTDICEPTIPFTNKFRLPLIDLEKLMSKTCLKKADTKDTQTFRDLSLKNKGICGFSSDSSEIKKLQERNSKNQEKINRLLTRMHKKGIAKDSFT